MGNGESMVRPGDLWLGNVRGLVEEFVVEDVSNVGGVWFVRIDGLWYPLKSRSSFKKRLGHATRMNFLFWTLILKHRDNSAGAHIDLKDLN